MKAFVTGGTGFVGFHVVRCLLEKGIHVVALTRDASDVAGLRSLGTRIIRGDVRDYDSLLGAMKGCDRVFHLAADYRLWVPDPDTMYDINVGGTRNVMSAALAAGVEKVIYTSTVGVLGTGLKDAPANEESPADLREMTGHYKKSKFLAEKEVRDFIRKGLPAVIVNPSTPVGPMDRKPTPTGRTIVDFLNGRMPAYIDTGLNFVDVEDVAEGHWLASQRGQIGQRYILGNANMTLGAFFGLLADITGRKPPGFRLPYLPVLLAAYADEALSRLTGKRPTIPLTGVKMAGKYMYYDPSKALRELGMPQSPVEQALHRAVNWFGGNGFVKEATFQKRRLEW